MLEALREQAAKGALVSAEPLRAALEKRAGTKVHPSSAQRLLARHGWRRPRHPRGDVGAQEARKKNFSQKARDTLSARGWADAPGPPDQTSAVVLLAQDEGRFGRISEARRARAPAEVRPTCPRQIVRESLYVFAALAPASGPLCALVAPSCDTAAMNVFLEQVGAELAGQRVLMQLDGAGWHRAKALRQPENVALLKPPAHSPRSTPPSISGITCAPRHGQPRLRLAQMR